jgi:hypothetical protein
MDLYIHSPARHHGVALNLLSTGTALTLIMNVVPSLKFTLLYILLY